MSLIGLLLGIFSSFHSKIEYKAQPTAKVAVDTHTKPVKAPIKRVKHNKVVYTKPPELALKMALKIEKETGVPHETITKIMFAESGYNTKAKHINKNGSIDSGLMQINSQHIPLAKKMGIDIFTPEGNADFAIYLIKKNGLRDWGYSKSTWSVL